MDDLKCFLKGMGSIINIKGASLKVNPTSGFEADARKLAQDWKTVGKYIEKSTHHAKHNKARSAE